MTAEIIDGKKIAEKIINDLKSKVKNLKEKPGLALVLVGNNPASEIYVNFKEKDSKEVGLYCERFNLDKDINEMDLLKLVNDLNQKTNIHGILVQLPLPKQIDANLIIDSILPHKDVDGFTPLNLGNLVSENTILAPATARAVLYLIESTGMEIKGKNAVVVGRSNTVGKPTAMMLLEKNATVTICHSKTKNLAEHTKKADILVVACGKPRLVTKDMVKQGSVVIDVGINREGGKLIGDVDFESVKEVAGYITPVPGGVGPMTRAMLLQNTLKAMELAKR
ncbi:bifunctional methylenetetrahydrofolate dehydrogenase/methenyltetrahydrofolate cyclohydrolase FolD [Candidatus Woesearchaeota archaeon]|jgi:methylenetetrahydrofolate dehydrogenase (NADP+)/methenyltetrahydrofolate cyclohydrolase|nr:bifunctional methylenetetrahydrofolate dehydrogenase/methenyltetrahydrofolate cyclohydrolase FolD [Candidatus Woesearchaeota archaeon]|tara:strand:- start:43926 stop:44765 length:840 start_codon:yes stop_codon:yes gene_type:complete